MSGFNMVDFDLNNITKSDMERLADSIEAYIELFEEVMIVPKEVEKKDEKEVKFALQECKKLVKKLRKGDISVFKDADEWNHLG